MKKCIKCNKYKELDMFPKIGNICKVCKYEYKKEWVKNNSEYTNKRKKYNKIYFKDNKKARKKRDAEYYINNKEKIKERKRKYHQRKMIEDPLYKLKYRISNNIRESIKKKGYTKKSKTHKILGCSFEEFKNHIESQWEEWMNWDNYGLYNGEGDYGWDLDHIIPNSNGLTEDEVIKLNHYSNFQPLCSYINRDVKKDKF